MVAEVRQQSVETEQQKFPFDIHFQQALLRLLCEDYVFGAKAVKYLQPEYFEHETLGWIYSCISNYASEYGVPPGLQVLQDQTRQLNPEVSGFYGEVVEKIRQTDLRDSDWLKDQVLEFVRRNLFVRAFREGRELYNSGKSEKAYDMMMDQMSQIDRTTWDPIDQSWLTDELPERMAMRRQQTLAGDAIPTGWAWLDHILGGGLHIGELGLWLAYAKGGKSTALIQHGMAATRMMQPTLHIVLEGSRQLIENRYDAGLTGEMYKNIKIGQMDASRYRAALNEYYWMRGMLVVRSFVDEWDVSILHIDEALRDLKRSRGWEPKLIIIDYADLMTGREKKYYRSETESQRAAYRDVKRLAGRGYAVWTASQAQRPKKDDYETAHILKSGSVADTYEKVRACDFLGSLNQTDAERSPALQQQLGHQVLRVYAEMYRDNQAGIETVMAFNPDHMRIWQKAGLSSPSDPAATSEPSLVGQNKNPLVQQAAFSG